MRSEVAVEPSLLDYVTEFIDEDAVSAALEADFDRDTTLIVFCRELFAQIFANVVGEPITGVGPTSADKASVLRRREGRKWSPSLRRLVAQFQHFSKLYGDLLGEGYSGGSETRTEFLFEFMPSLLKDLQIWATTLPDKELEKAVGVAGGRYDDYLSAWEPDWESDDR